MNLIQVFFLCLTTGSFNIITVEALFQGFSIKKEFDVSLKPFVWKPISIFKEKLSPFGRFGVRHGIEKRELNSVEPAPVIEHLYVEPTASIGPFLTPILVNKPEEVTISPELIITPKPLLQPEFSSLPPPSITPSVNRPITSFRPGPSFVIPSLVPFESTTKSTELIKPVPIFRPEFQSTPIPLRPPQLASSTLITNPISLITQNDEPGSVIGQPLLPISTSPVPTPRPFDYLLNTPVPVSIPPSDFGVRNLLNSNPNLSEILQIQVPNSLPNAKQPGTLPELIQSNIASVMVPTIIPSTASNDIINLGAARATAQSTGLLNTDIGKADVVNDYLNAVNRQLPLSKSDIKNVPFLPNNSIESENSTGNQLDDSVLIRGTKLALHFGNIFAQLMSQFFSNARLTLSQLPELRIRE